MRHWFTAIGVVSGDAILKMQQMFSGVTCTCTHCSVLQTVQFIISAEFSPSLHFLFKFISAPLIGTSFEPFSSLWQTMCTVCTSSLWGVPLFRRQLIVCIRASVRENVYKEKKTVLIAINSAFKAGQVNSLW